MELGKEAVNIDPAALIALCDAMDSLGPSVALIKEPLSALTAAVRTLLSEREWRLIKTSPRDGTVFLAFSNGKMQSAHWYADMFDELVLGGAGWCYAAWNMPTHWMPLPSGPVVPPESK